MNEILQYGALGILGVLVLFIVPYLIKWLVGFIGQLREEICSMRQDFTKTIDNHLESQMKALNELTNAIERLCRLWENGK